MQSEKDIEFEDFSKAVEEVTRKKKDEDGSAKQNRELIKKAVEL